MNEHSRLHQPFGLYRSVAVFFVTTALTLVASMSGCGVVPVDPADNSNTNGDGPLNARASDCVGCHTNESLLKLVARDEPPPTEAAGEG